MIFVATPLSKFVEEHPTIKILALSFLLLIGFTLIVEGFQLHIPKGYIYFAMGFSILVEMLNLRVRQRPAAPVVLRERYTAELLPVPVAMESGVRSAGRKSAKRKTGKKRR
jgi:predicted tellurium resistance membrane protein TerC